MDKALKQEAAIRQQGQLLEMEGPGAGDYDPSSPLEDNEKGRYIQDLCEWHDLHYAEVRTYVRDRTLARQKKESAANRCQICGAADVAVDTHHVEPRSKGGADAAENMIVLCPNCHRDVHGRKAQIHRTPEGHLVAVTKDREIVKIPHTDDRGAAISHANQCLAEHIAADFARLDTTTQGKVLERLSGLTRSAPPSNVH